VYSTPAHFCTIIVENFTDESASLYQPGNQVPNNPLGSVRKRRPQSRRIELLLRTRREGSSVADVQSFCWLQKP